MIAGDIPVCWKAANLTPIFTPTHPNITRLRPTHLDEDLPEIRAPGASSDTQTSTSRLRAESGLRLGPYLLALRLVHVLDSRLLSESWVGSSCRYRVSGG